MSEKRSGPSFNAGRDQHIAYAEQGAASLHTHIANTGGSAEISISAELKALREILAGLGASTVPVDAAENAADAPKPEHQKVISYVENAVKLASTANGFAEQADKLIPRLQHIATWAGQTWDTWRSALGL